MSWVDTIGSLGLVVALLALNWRAFRADAGHMSTQTKMIMGASWVGIFAVLAFVLGRLG